MKYIKNFLFEESDRNDEIKKKYGYESEDWVNDGDDEDGDIPDKLKKLKDDVSRLNDHKKKPGLQLHSSGRGLIGTIQGKKIISNLKIGEFYLCKMTYGSRFIKGDIHEILDIKGKYVFMRFYKDNKPVRFKMSMKTFLQVFEHDKEIEKKI